MVKVAVGMMGSSVAGGSASLSTISQTQSFLSILKAHGIQEIDTARVYASGRSEELLGEAHASDDFAISTKAPAFSPGSLSRENILKNCAASLSALQIDDTRNESTSTTTTDTRTTITEKATTPELDIYYLHGPDPSTPLQDQCDAINDLYTQNKFSRFGISNIDIPSIESIHSYCVSKNYVLPTVYQGAYNPLHRNAETELLPLLRRLGMAFYAYSPLAGGLLAKRDIEEVLTPAPGSRYDAMKVFGDLYVNAETIEGLRELKSVCERAEGIISVLEATLRWELHHSALGEGDAIILGASSAEQIEASLKAAEGGRLSGEVVEAFERLWERTKGNAPAATL